MKLKSRNILCLLAAAALLLTVCGCKKKAAESSKFQIIPSGDVIQYLRDNTNEFDCKNGGLSLCRDGFHLSYI